MSEPFVAEIRIFPFSFPPKNWAWCNGQSMPIAQNSALFSLLGTVYGGDGVKNFALPNLQGRAPMHPGQSNGPVTHKLGETGGETTVLLTETTMAAHTHPWNTRAGDPGEDRTPVGEALARSVGGNIYGAVGTMKPMFEQALPPIGGNQLHNNMQPYLTLYFNIALAGVMPVHP